MTLSAKTKKLSDYSKEFFQAWELAIIGQLSIPFPLKGTATNFRHQLYAFRKRYREEGVDYQMADKMYQIDLVVSENDEDKQFYVKNRATENWKDIVRQKIAATTVEGALVTNLEERLAEPPSEPESVMDDTLKKLGFGTDT